MSSLKTALICFVSLIAGNIVLSVILGFGPLNSNNFWISSSCTIALYLVYLMVFIIFYKNVEKKDFSFRLNTKNTLSSILIVLLFIACFMLVQQAFIDIFKLMGYNDSGAISVSVHGWGQFLMCTFVMCILPAVIEELLFRGVIFKSMRHLGFITAVLVSALLFAVYHLSPSQLVYQFIMGIVFASVYEFTGNLIYSMIMHFINNFFIVAYTFIVGNDLAYSWNAYTVVTAILLAVCGGVVIIGLVRGLNREEHAGKTK